MNKRKWKDNPEYKDDDILSRISEAVGYRPSTVTKDYSSCIVIKGVPLSLAENPFKITQVSFSPSRLIPEEEIYEEEKEKLKRNIKLSLKKFRNSRLKYLEMLYSPFPDVQKVLERFNKPGNGNNMEQKLSDARKKLEEMGFSKEEINSVCFLSKEKALKFATDELADFMQPILSEFDPIFGKLSSLNPEERKKAFSTVIRAWEEAAEEWESEEKESLHELSPGLLARLSRSDISFAQQMKNIANSSFRSMTDFDTALGAMLISGMFPPAALLFVLPMLVPGLLDLFFEELSLEREGKSKDQSALIADEMGRLFASKAAGNAMMTEMALRLANGESPERVLNDMSRIKDKIRDIFERAYRSGKNIFSSFSHNEAIQPKGADHIKLKEETRELAQATLHEFWDESKERAFLSIEDSARIEAEIANSVKFNIGEDKISCNLKKISGKSAFHEVKFQQAEQNIKEYVSHLNKLIELDRDKNLLTVSSNFIPPFVTVATLYSSDYGVFSNKIGPQSGTSMLETKILLKALQGMTDEDCGKRGAIVLAVDAFVRMLPQEFLGYVNKAVDDFFLNRLGDTTIEKANYLREISETIEMSFTELEQRIKSLPEQSRNVAGAILFLSRVRDHGFNDMLARIYDVAPLDVNTAFIESMAALKEMDDSQLNEVAADLYTLFNRTVAEPGLIDAIKNHEAMLETDKSHEASPEPEKRKATDEDAKVFEIER